MGLGSCDLLHFDIETRSIYVSGVTGLAETGELVRFQPLQNNFIYFMKQSLQPSSSAERSWSDSLSNLVFVKSFDTLYELITANDVR